ncbi:MAG: hypothetical protein IKA00_01115 [Prevotella sp.]|nr:hypothetical protein [Prevotella sp.]
MKYRRYKIIQFSEEEDVQFGKSWLILTKTAGLDPNCGAGFPETDLYGKGEFTEFFIVPYDNWVMDEIEDIALRGDLWSPDTDDWTMDEQNRIVDGVPVITHHYCGKLHNKAKKPDGSDSRIVSWMPLSQLILAEKSLLEHDTDAATGIDYFVCGTVKGFVSPSAKKELANEVYSTSDFKVAMVSVHEAEPKPWLLYIPPQHTLAIRNCSFQDQADFLLKIGEWRQAFPWAKRAMERSLEEMGKTFKEYNKLNEDPIESPEAGILCDVFIETNGQHFLPAIRNLLSIFDMAIGSVDMMNYENELKDIKEIVDKMVRDAELP